MGVRLFFLLAFEGRIGVEGQKVRLLWQIESSPFFTSLNIMLSRKKYSIELTSAAKGLPPLGVCVHGLIGVVWRLLLLLLLEPVDDVHGLLGRDGRSRKPSQVSWYSFAKSIRVRFFVVVDLEQAVEGRSSCRLVATVRPELLSDLKEGPLLYVKYDFGNDSIRSISIVE